MSASGEQGGGCNLDEDIHPELWGQHNHIMFFFVLLNWLLNTVSLNKKQVLYNILYNMHYKTSPLAIQTGLVNQQEYQKMQILLQINY